jgi:thiopeptide-type bacteriocin biosynthesis protein
VSLDSDFAAGVVVLRTPLLPFDDIERWTAGVDDRALLRERLSSLLERPEIREALFVASPDLVESLAYWRRDPTSKKGQRAEHAVVRYLLRMASRPTPFGLFSGCTAGTVGERTRLALGGRADYQRHSRLDMDYLFALCERLGNDRVLRAEMLFRPNPSLYEAGGRLRYAEARLAGRLRTYHFVAVDAFDALRTTLERAGGGATIAALANDLVAADPESEITPEEAESFVHDLIDNQLLLPDLAPAVTGEESTPALLRQLEGLHGARDATERLGAAQRALAEIDAQGLGTPIERYHEAARSLEPLGVPVEMSRLFQIDLFKPAPDVVIGETAIAEILRGVELLHRLVVKPRHEPLLEEFRRSFRDRYGEGREVPLLAALDEESGIGFERSALPGAEASPLLARLPLNVREQPPIAWTPGDATLVRLLAASLTEGRMEVQLTEDAVKQIENRDRPPLPDAFHTVAILAAASATALDRGDFRLFLHNAAGPSGARMLGRFCHADERIRLGVETHLAAEEALAPDVLFAEIVHLPAGRVGNVLARPLLRQYEIPFLGRSGAPPERQIAVSDLLVTVVGDRIRLRSKSRDREVVPRLTTAHNTTGESLGVYRFLAALQQAVWMEWSWGPLEAAAFLPRVVSGRLVLARARWRLRADEIEPLAAASGSKRHLVAQEWRRKHRMPRYVALVDSDHELLLDFDNPLNVDAVVELFKNRDEVRLVELFPSPEERCVDGPEGRFFHELIVPFVRRPTPARPRGPRVVGAAGNVTRTFPPGSEWLYAKLYTGSGTADRLLRDEIAPLAHAALAEGSARSWFFIRYGDPAWHLRVRFRGRPDVAHLFERLRDEGTAWKFQLDTYEREVERYGGDDAIELSEEIFFHDSEAVLEMLDLFTTDAGAEWRWRAILAGIDRLLDDFGFGLEARLKLAEQCRDGFAKQYRYETLRGRLADRLRPQRAMLERLLFRPESAPDEIQPALAALRRRSEAIREVVRELRARERRGRLQTQLDAIVPNYIHMFVNRLSRSAGPEHEMVLYDYLVQLYRSELARARASSSQLVEVLHE